MALSIPNKLIQANKLIIEGNHDAALNLLRSFEQREGHDLQDSLICELFRCQILFQQGLYENLLIITEQAYKDSLELGLSPLSLDLLMWKAHALIYLFRWDDVNTVINEGEELLKNLVQKLDTKYKHREASLAFVKGMYIFRGKRDSHLALKYLKHNLALQEKFGTKPEIISTKLQIAVVLSHGKGELDYANKYLEHGMALAKEINNKYNIAWGLQILGVIYAFKGELDKSIQIGRQSLKIYKELNNNSKIAELLNNMAESYLIKGDLNLSLEMAKQCLALRSELGRIRDIAHIYLLLILIFIEKGNLGQAQEYLDDMEKQVIQVEDKQINRWYLFMKAMILKKSLRARKRAKAEEILTNIIDEEDSDYELIINALLNLSELLLAELYITNEIEILDEVKPLIAQLLDLAEKSHSYWVWGETFLLQAKLALLSLNLKEARRFLTQGQKIAKKYGLELLAMKISNEHDEILRQTTIWENLKESEIPLSERMKLARLSDQMENMAKRRAIKVPKLLDEEPVLFLIVSEGGVPFFSYSFIEDKIFEDHLFGGFLTAINSFINEMFSEGLNRALFGEHTLLMNSVPPFLMFYIYKGQSYSAQKRIKKFINEITSNKEVWRIFEKFYQANRKIQIIDIPFLENLIKEIFIEKTLH